jgi:hypothetical protein
MNKENDMFISCNYKPVQEHIIIIMTTVTMIHILSLYLSIFFFIYCFLLSSFSFYCSIVFDTRNASLGSMFL